MLNKHKFTYRLLFALLFVASMLGSPAFAQSDSAKVKVQVMNYDKEPLPGETLYFIADDQVKMGTSDANGKISLNLLEGRNYTIQVKGIGSSEIVSQLEIPKPKPGYGPLTYEVEVLINPATAFTLDQVFFDPDKAALKPEAYRELNELVKALKAKPYMVIEIAGHTDNVGDADYNKTLSLKRAQAVKTYLVSKGIQPERIVAKGYGEEQPVDTNDTPSGRKMNRRTEVRILENPQ